MAPERLDEFARVVTKYVLGDTAEFNALKERLSMMEHAKTKAGAAALGYLIAKEEIASDPYEKHEESVIYEKLTEILESYYSCLIDRARAQDEIMTEVYYWLDRQLERLGYGKCPMSDRNVARNEIAEIFRCLIVSRES